MKNGALVPLVLRLKRHSCFDVLLRREGTGRVGRGCGSDGGLIHLKLCFAACACAVISVLYFVVVFKKHMHPVRCSILVPSACAVRVHVFISVHFVVVVFKTYASSQMLNTCAK